jgi:hypothetical protein
MALENVQAISGGGEIIHVLPANNLCCHGFWQFWPELFFIALFREQWQGEHSGI